MKLEETQRILRESPKKIKESPKKVVEYNRYDSDFIASFLLRIVLIIFLAISISRRDWMWTIGCSITILVSFAPTILKRDFGITLPWVLDLMISLALFLHLGGVIFNLYGIIPGYDIMTHFVTSILIGFLAFVIIYVLDRYSKNLSMDVYGMAFLVIIFAMAMGVVWEFFEWGMDLAFGTHEQWGLQDTMKDLLVDTVAGIFIAVIGVQLVKKGKIEKITEEFGDQLGKTVIPKLDAKAKK
jgi:hypothetical protein